MTDRLATEAEANILAAAIRRELVTLRQGLGISAGAVERVGKQISRLPAVDDERRRNSNLPRHVAAYNVVRCAIQAGVSNLRHRQVLTRTLNIDGLGPGSTLVERREELCKHVLHLKLGNNYLNLEELAFQELVAVLLTIERSPCRAVDPLPFRSHADRLRELLASHLGDEAVIRVPMAQLLGTIISWIPDAADDTEREEIVDLMVSYLPNLQPIIWGPSRISPYLGAQSLPDKWQPEVTADNRRRLLKELFSVLVAALRSAHPPLPSRLMEALLWNDRLGDPLFEKQTLEQLAPQYLRDIPPSQGRTATADYFRRRYDYFRRLGTLMEEYDNDNIWASILGQPADRNPADEPDVELPHHRTGREEGATTSDPDPRRQDKSKSNGNTPPPRRSRRRRSRE